MGRVDSKVAVVTGGASGIGRSTCRLLAREGARVAVVDLADEPGRQVVTEIEADRGTAGYWQMDVSVEADVRRAFGSIDSRFGGIDILVTCAGISGPDKPPHEISEDEFDGLYAVDVKGPFFCTKHVIPYMKEGGGGSIVHIGSIYALIGNADDPLYHSAKAAVRMMAKTDAMVYAKDKIRVNCVHPGCTLTPFNIAKARLMPRGVEGFIEDISKLHPIGHLADPEDIAYAVLYLASDESRFVTGSDLVIDGGYTVP